MFREAIPSISLAHFSSLYLWMHFILQINLIVAAFFTPITHQPVGLDAKNHQIRPNTPPGWCFFNCPPSIEAHGWMTFSSCSSDVRWFAIPGTLLLLYSRHFSRVHTSFSATEYQTQKSCKTYAIDLLSRCCQSAISPIRAPKWNP